MDEEKAQEKHQMQKHAPQALSHHSSEHTAARPVSLLKLMQFSAGIVSSLSVQPSHLTGRVEGQWLECRARLGGRLCSLTVSCAVTSHTAGSATSRPGFCCLGWVLLVTLWDQLSCAPGQEFSLV